MTPTPKKGTQPRRKRARHGLLDEFRAAQKRVGWTAEDRAGWLLTLARRDLSYETRQLAATSEAEAAAVRWEALAFAKGTREFSVSESDLPSWSGVTKAHTRLRIMVLAELRNGRPARVETRWSGALTIGSDGRVSGHSLTGELPFLDGFLVQTYEALARLATEKRRLRFCPKCQHPFVARGRQVYDSGTCSQSHRTALYRTKHREKFRAYRQRYYRERVAERLGKPVEKIPFRTLKRRETN